MTLAGHCVKGTPRKSISKACFLPHNDKALNNRSDSVAPGCKYEVVSNLCHSPATQAGCCCKLLLISILPKSRCKISLSRLPGIDPCGHSVHLLINPSRIRHALALRRKGLKQYTYRFPLAVRGAGCRLPNATWMVSENHSTAPCPFR